MSNTLEEFTAELNRLFFLREFSFDRNTFRAACGQEYELADHVISMPRGTLLFQLKEREEDAPTDHAAMITWFRKKILRKACGQLADSQRFLGEEGSLLVRNQRGHEHNLSGRTENVVSIILYASSTPPPAWIRAQRHYVSKRAGFVHIMDIRDYYHLCHTLALPAELFGFFRFRQDILLRSPSCTWPEAQITAQYIMDTDEALPSDQVRNVLQLAQDDIPSFDLSGLLTKFGDKVTGASSTRGSDADSYTYYRVLVELAQMTRAEMRSFKKLFDWAVKMAGDENVQTPARLLSLTSQVGFVVIPIHGNAFDMRINALHNYTLAMKYDYKLERQIGVSIAKCDDMLEIDWMYAEAPWEPDPQMDEFLANDYPFRQRPQPRASYRYQFHKDAEDAD